MKAKAKPTVKQKIKLDLTEVENLAARGLTREQIAHSLGISERTLYNNQSKDAEFAAALKKGEAKGIAEVSNVLFQNALRGDITACIFYLKCRAGWKDKQTIEVTGEAGGAVQLQTEVKAPTLSELMQAMHVNNALVKQKMAAEGK